MTMIIVRGVPWMLLGQRVTADATIKDGGMIDAMCVLNSTRTTNILYLSRYK